MATRDTRRRFLELLKAQERAVQSAFLASVGDVVEASEAKIAAIVGALERGDIAGAVEAAMIGEAFYARLDRSIEGAFVAGALYAQGALPKRPFGPGGGRLVVRFDQRNPRAERWLREASSRRVVEVTEATRETIREVLTASMEAGRHPRGAALDLVGRVVRGKGGRRAGGVIGLHSDFAGHVTAARAELRDPERMGDYFSRKARDKRFDRTVAKALREGRPVPQATVDRIAGRYADRLLAIRGETIARSETIEALNAGRHEGMAQVIDAPDNEILHSDVVRVWDATGDSRTRPEHAAMDGQKQPFDVPFRAPDGSLLMHPGDRSLGASGAMTIRCRCYMPEKVDFVAVARRRRATPA